MTRFLSTRAWALAFAIGVLFLHAPVQAQSPDREAGIGTNGAPVTGSDARWSVTLLGARPRDSWAEHAVEFLRDEGLDDVTCTGGHRGWLVGRVPIRCTVHPLSKRPRMSWLLEISREVRGHLHAGITAGDTPLYRVHGSGFPNALGGEDGSPVSVNLSTGRSATLLAPFAALRLDPLLVQAGPALYRIESRTHGPHNSLRESRNRPGYLLGTGFVLTTGRGPTLEARAQYRGVPGSIESAPYSAELAYGWDPWTRTHEGTAAYTLPPSSSSASHWLLAFGVGMRW
jgi:hypothetical protein